ncbi:MAG: hypothetical protein A3E87_00460 [Gammaproteobacteria bacterium RIFCSPHIGHO2_12_FULL_35_23]|nr:MAG: hypothetical protein A3E87_00460 [Gammaproteobacteria bacterium RIFCSPHIGHO2_12_FULL_35_23]
MKLKRKTAKLAYLKINNKASNSAKFKKKINQLTRLSIETNNQALEKKYIPSQLLCINIINLQKS